MIRQRNFVLSHVFLMAGFALMALFANRMLFDYAFVYMMIFSIYIGNADFADKSWINDRSYAVLIQFISIVIALSCCIFCRFIFIPYMAEDDVLTIDAVNHIDDKSARVMCYGSIDAGSYVIFLGMKPYMDCRMETYDIAINGKTDAMQELVDFSIDMFKVEDPDSVFMTFQDKYNFDYWIVRKSDCPLALINSLIKHGQVVYENDMYTLYEYVS